MRVRIDHEDGHDIVSDREIPDFLRRYGDIEVTPLGHTGTPRIPDPWEPYYEGRSR